MKSMFVKFYGVRGSYSVPGKDTVRYGGNTTCVLIAKEDDDGKIFPIVIDTGTGAVNLGKDILSCYFAGKLGSPILPIFYTHLHPDHTQGFPFFAPNFIKDFKIDLYGMETLRKNVGQILNSTMLPPQFPIEYKDLKSIREHHVLSDGDVIKIGPFEIKTMQAYAPSHPQQGALYYRITDITNGDSVACIWDCESKVGGDQRVAQFARGANMIIHDTQYTTEEYLDSKMVVQGFGHSTYDMAIENAMLAGLKDKLVCVHYNPNHSDNKLDSIHNDIIQRSKIADNSIYGFDIHMAHEGEEIQVRK